MVVGWSSFLSCRLCQVIACLQVGSSTCLFYVLYRIMLAGNLMKDGWEEMGDGLAMGKKPWDKRRQMVHRLGNQIW
jgi:hypothetical protein